jgi:hypothetical protein
MVIASLGKVWLPNSTRTEDPTMTDDMMNLRTLLEKSADADLLREMIDIPHRDRTAWLGM